MFGFVGLVDFIIEKTELELNEKLNVVATGGLSSVISPLTKTIKTIKPMLTLNRLYHINKFVNSTQ